MNWEENQTSNRWLVLAFFVAVVANSGAVGCFLPLLKIEHGSVIRPMGAAGSSFLFVLLGFLVGLPIATQAILTSTRRLQRGLSIIVLVLCLTPMPLGGIALHTIARICGFGFAE
ncbi:MAG: hypothetical protein R3C01_17535 [Planctomycetaceae bacterium]